MVALNFGYCGFCNTMHDNAGPNSITPALCQVCEACYAYCAHLPECVWPDTKKTEAPLPNTMNTPTKTTHAAENPPTKNLQEAFESWYASSKLLNTSTSVEEIYKEFDTFVREILDPVEPGKMYLQVNMDNGTVKDMSLLDGACLFKNQDGDYVVVDGKKRTRIGKRVAVMGS